MAQPPDPHHGSVLWTSPAGSDLEPAGFVCLERWRPGGAVLFRQNLHSLEQTRRLVGDLKAASAGSIQFVAVDQEGGRVTRLPLPATSFPSAEALAATRDPSLAEAAARASGRELRAFGITVNLAPVADVNANPLNPSIGSRSFGSRPDQVSRFVAAQVRGYLDGGVLPVAKHFPGKGGTPVDPHLDLPVIDADLETLRRRDLPPFRAAIGAGLPITMIGHAAFPALDPEGRTLPSTLAPAVYRLLRSPEVGFQGLAVSDALRMQAVADRFGLPEACVLALAAGADAVLPLAEDEGCLAAIATALHSGAVSEARFAEALQRQDDARRVLDSLPDVEPNDVHWSAHALLALEIARKAVTVRRDTTGTLPLSAKRPILLIEFSADVISQVEETDHAATSFAALLARVSQAEVATVSVPAKRIEPTDRERVLRAIDASDPQTQIVVGVREALLFEEQARLVSDVVAAAGSRLLVAVALRSGADVEALGDAGTVVAAFSDVPASLQAAAEVLLGTTRPHAMWL